MSSTISAASSTANTVISSTGIGSGLDINSIVTSLTKAHGLAQNTQLSDRHTALTAQVSAYGTFSSALSVLQATLTTLKTSSALAGRTVVLGDTTIATGTATAHAIPAQYSLTVQNLATAASLSSKAFANENSAVGTGALTIAVGGNSSSINIDPSNNTLAGIVSAINGAPDNPGVTASILTTSAGARLVLSGTVTGTANAIKVTQAGGDGGLSALVYDPANATTNLTQTQAAQDANFTVNGFGATSASNQVTSVISGVTLNLLKTTAVGTPTTLTVGTDPAGAQASIGTFVTALNGLITSIHSLTSYDPSTQTAGPLLGNATLQSFQSQLHGILDQVKSGNTGAAATSLASLGITANIQGTYDSNSTTLGNALTGNLSSVTGFFGGADGIASQLDSLIKGYTQPGGLLDSINKGLQSSLSDVANQQTALNARLATYSATLTKEYNAMDMAVALLKQTQTYLTAEFNPNSGSASSSSSSALSSGTLKTGA
ncbi:MAG TPA: flagellar filament capping protein FliD [Steroidobacteraceae bacterium]|jgi:flagellar hook-associated protein 2|nr:flagellar filament capping protein FliD [Steroidobacteraceae bacterium]